MSSRSMNCLFENVSAECTGKLCRVAWHGVTYLGILKWHSGTYYLGNLLCRM